MSIAYEPEKPKSGEDFVARLTTAEGERLAIRIGRFRREAQQGEPGRGAKYVQRGIRVFSGSERGSGIDGRQFPQAEYWDDKDFELADIPYITVFLLEASAGPEPDSLEGFLQTLEVFMSDPQPVPSEFFERHGTAPGSLDEFFRQMDDFLVNREVVASGDSQRTAGATRPRVAREGRPDYSQLELF